MPKAIAQHNGAGERPVRVRIGLTAGDPIREGYDTFGRHVILTSRIVNQAQGGRILVSSLLEELAESVGDIAFGEGQGGEPRGPAGQHRLFEVRWPEK